MPAGGSPVSNNAFINIEQIVGYCKLKASFDTRVRTKKKYINLIVTINQDYQKHCKQITGLTK